MPQDKSPAAQAAPVPKPKPPEPPPEFREGDIATMDAAALIAILNDANASDFRKSKACQRAGELGVKEAVPALAALLPNARLSTYARYGLEPIPDPAVDEALRAALSKLKGILLIGVINSIGKRRDSAAAPALAKKIYDRDGEVCRTAAMALGSIGGAFATKELQTALNKTKDAARVAVSDGCLICAERLLDDGKREQALSLYASLSDPDIPKFARLAAMSAIVREETSLGRPRS